MIKKFINNLSIFLFIITFFYLSFQNSLVLEYSLLQLRNIDDLALLNSIVRLKNFIYEKNLAYIFSFIDYAYGNLFWILNSIFLIPLTLFNNDEIVIFIARQITVFFAFGCLYLIIKISQCFGTCKTTANIIGLFFIFTPNFFEWSMRFHVNYYSVFFILLSLLILLKSNERLLKNIIYSSIFFGVGVGIKLTGILLYPFLILILINKFFFFKIKNKIFLLFIYNIIFLFAFIIAFCPALLLSFFYLEEAKKIFGLIFFFKNLGNSTDYLDRTLLFKMSIKWYYQIFIFIILILVGTWWSFKEYSKYNNKIPAILLITILAEFFFVILYFNKPSVYIAAYTISISSLLPILLSGFKFINKEIIRFFALYSLLILQIFLNFDFIKDKSLKHYKLVNSDTYINSRKILKEMNSKIDQNLLKKNNKVLLDANSFFPNTLGSQIYVTFNYLNETSNIELFKKYNIDYTYIVLNTKNLENISFNGKQIEYDNRQLLKKKGYFDKNKEYKLLYNSDDIELYELIIK